MKISDTRKKYYTKIWVYKKRREGFKERGNKEALHNATKKISQWKHQIRRIDQRQSVVTNLILEVNEYFEVDIMARIFNKRHNLARNVFYKYGIEHNLQGVFLARSLGRIRTKTAGECRLRFTKSFSQNTGNKEIYHKFKTFLEINAKKAA